MTLLCCVRLVLPAAVALLYGCLSTVAAGQSEASASIIPDIRSIAPDLVVPPLTTSPPAAGKRVKWLPNPEWKNLHCVLTLPQNYDSSNQYPLIVEFAGNGGFENEYGDRSDGVPEGSNLGWGISGGRNFVWLCVPFVTSLEDTPEIAKLWWGQPPEFAPEPTARFCKLAVSTLCKQVAINQEAILICGFSRGAIACNFIGLHDAEIADLWCGSFAYSHFDGSRDWGLPGCERDDVAQRFDRWRRRGRFPILITHETIRTSDRKNPRGLNSTKAALGPLLFDSDPVTWLETGFRNHNDAWMLRPSPAREAVRDWVHGIPSIRAAVEHLTPN